MLLFLESIGTGEIVIVFLFILIFFGADKIPGLARNLGKGIRQIKDATNDLQDEIKKTTTDIKREANINKAHFIETRRTLESPVKEFTKDLERSGGEINDNIEGMEQHSSSQKEVKDQLKPIDTSIEKEVSKPAPEIKDGPQPIKKRDQQNVD